MMASYNTAILHLANYYLEHRDDISGYHDDISGYHDDISGYHDDISGYYLDGAIDMIHNIYGVRVERVYSDMYKIADILMED